MLEISEIIYKLRNLDHLVTQIKEHESRHGENKYNKNPYTDFEVLGK